MSQRNIHRFLLLFALIGIGLRTGLFLITSVVPAVLDQRSLFIPQDWISIENIQPSCLSIQPRRARTTPELSFSIHNTCGGTISILSEHLSKPQSSSVVGRLLNQEESVSFENGGESSHQRSDRTLGVYNSIPNSKDECSERRN